MSEKPPTTPADERFDVYDLPCLHPLCGGVPFHEAMRCSEAGLVVVKVGADIPIQQLIQHKVDLKEYALLVSERMIRAQQSTWARGVA